MSKNHTSIDNYKKKVINFNERSNSSYDILIGWRIHTNFACIQSPNKSLHFAAHYISTAHSTSFSPERKKVSRFSCKLVI